MAVTMLMPWAAATASSSWNNTNPTPAYIPDTLLSQAKASPNDTFKVIVQGDGSDSADRLASMLARWAADTDHQWSDQHNKAINTYQRWQTAFAKDRADWVTKSSRFSLTGKKGDQNAAQQAQQQLNNDQSNLNQANSDVTATDGTFTTDPNAILRQQLKDEFSSISGVAMTLRGRQIVGLINHVKEGLLSITPDSPAETAGGVAYGAGGRWSSDQLWPYESGASNNWLGDKYDGSVQGNEPSIAIVDSGVQSRSDFGDRIVASVNLSSLPNNSAGDGRGHGTFVAGVAADSATDYTGTNPIAKLVSIDVMDDNGVGLTSDIIKSCQWILDHQAQYNIRVANFSLHSAITAPFFIDPLDRAVEQLWFHGIVVVVASGNYGVAGSPSGVLFSPGDDPFVITVGAADLGTSARTSDDKIAPWSAWGYTIDGFAKPDLSAPGRYMIGPVPSSSTLVSERPGNVTAPGYMQLSGTSFAAPVVAGAAADILARHPSFTPDQVKGALMVTARKMPLATSFSEGVGEISANAATYVNRPPNPNAGLDAFVKAASSGTSFDSASWMKTVQSNASWDSVSWNDVSWNSASWDSVSWNSVSWDSASWNDASWNDASWNDASWNDASWNDSSREDAAEGDATADSDVYTISQDDLQALLADPSVAPDPSTLPDWLVVPSTTSSTSTSSTTTTPTTTTSSTTTSTTPTTTTSSTTTTDTTSTTTTTPTTTTTTTTTTPSTTTTAGP